MNGILESKRSPVELPGGGSVRPCEALNLAGWIVDYERACGIPPTLGELPEDFRSLVEKLSRWQPGPRDGQLMPIVVKEALRLTCQN
jgi:hypothetical protein